MLSLPFHKEGFSTKRRFSADIELERQESLNQLKKFIEECFQEKQEITFEYFKTICLNVSSEMFLCLYLIIKQNLPNSNQFEKFKKFKNLQIEEKLEIQELLASPKILTKFDPVSKIIKHAFSRKRRNSNWISKNNFHDIFVFDLKQNETKNKYHPTESIRMCNKIFHKKEIFQSPSDIHKEKILNQNSEIDIIFCKCGRNIKDDSQTKCNVCKNIDKIGQIVGEPYKLSKKGEYNKSSYILDKYELLHRSKKMSNKYCCKILTSCFIEEDFPVLKDGKLLNTLKIIWMNKTLKLGFDTSEEFLKWLNALKTIVGYSDIKDFYEIGNQIGSGKFSIVHKGIHKKTGVTVAIKIIEKKQMKAVDTENVFREIEILKLCQHPNIIRLFDVFVNSSLIYIVQEYIAGGDLSLFLMQKNYSISITEAISIIQALANAINYFHSFGIVHRDLKPENILFPESLNCYELKIVDFGLSKIIGPNERCTEPFGTLGFVAPEIIQRKEYTQNVDIWSLGIICHLLILGFLPFYDESERKIAEYYII